VQIFRFFFGSISSVGPCFGGGTGLRGTLGHHAAESRGLAGRRAPQPSAAAERLILRGVRLLRERKRSPVPGRYAARRGGVPAVYKGGLPGGRLKKVLDYIGDNLTEDLSLSRLAAVAGMSPHYFSELFRQSTGRPPHRFVLLQRIGRAKEQLRNPRRSVIDAGLEAGFQNPSHFARTFRQLVGVTPRQFRGKD